MKMDHAQHAACCMHVRMCLVGILGRRWMMWRKKDPVARSWTTDEDEVTVNRNDVSRATKQLSTADTRPLRMTKTECYRVTASQRGSETNQKQTSRHGGALG